MSWGQLTVGGFTFREEVTASVSRDSLQVAGQESHPPSTRAFVEAADEAINALPGLIVPVVFTDKVRLTGFYRVDDARSDFRRVQSGAFQTTTWGMTLTRVGGARDVEIESRVPTIARTNDIPGTQFPVIWHAPAPGYTSYLTGTTVPDATVTRDSADGPVVVQLGIPAFSPRWTIPATDYLRAAARLYADGFLRLGTTSPASAAWEVNNGLVRLTPGAAGAVVVECWDSGAWASARAYKFFAAADLTTTPELTVVRNDPEEVTVRLTYPTATGRVAVDLGLRRGARFLTGVIKRHSAATLGVLGVTDAAATSVSGGVRQVAADSGNRFVVGSSRQTVADTVNGGITLAAVTKLDFFLGHQVGAPGTSSPAVGDAFADLLAQYLGSTGERSAVVLR